MLRKDQRCVLEGYFALVILLSRMTDRIKGMHANKLPHIFHSVIVPFRHSVLHNAAQTGFSFLYVTEKK